MLYPNSVIDFKKGERCVLLSETPVTLDLTISRFHYVDVAISSVIQTTLLAGLAFFVVAYDIACKYSVNFKKRVLEGPVKLIDIKADELFIVWLIGKFHLGGHQPECSDKYSFNYTRGVGRGCGELIETVWSYLDYHKYSTREMGRGPRREMLTDAMNEWNMGKLVRLGGQNHTRPGAQCSHPLKHPERQNCFQKQCSRQL